VKADPTTWSRSLMPIATVAIDPPRVPRSVMAPSRQMKPRPFPFVAALIPTMCPCSLIAWAMLIGPPSVPMSTIVPACQRKARHGALAAGEAVLVPATWPRSLMPIA
jgi:hypothetical protein